MTFKEMVREACLVWHCMELKSRRCISSKKMHLWWWRWEKFKLLYESSAIQVHLTKHYSSSSDYTCCKRWFWLLCDFRKHESMGIWIFELFILHDWGTKYQHYLGSLCPCHRANPQALFGSVVLKCQRVHLGKGKACSFTKWTLIKFTESAEGLPMYNLSRLLYRESALHVVLL